MHFAVLPQERTGLREGRPVSHSKNRKRIRYVVENLPNDLAEVVQRDREARSASQRSQIVDLVVLPEDRVELRIPRSRIDLAVLRGPSNLSELIDRGRKAVVTTGQRAQVLQAAVSPRERVGDEKVSTAYRVEASGHWSKDGGICSPDDRASIVDDLDARLAVHGTLWATERSQIHELVMMVRGVLRLRGRLSDYQKGASQRYRDKPPHDSEIHVALLRSEERRVGKE